MPAKLARTDRLRPIRHSAADLLQNAILGGSYRPGQEIQQLPIARELSLSQSSAREVLQELENRGLIVKTGRSWRVSQLSLDTLRDMYQVRAVLEPLACRLAAFGWREADSARLERCLATMRQGFDEKDYPAHSRADMEFHQIIWQTQPNRALEKQLTLLCIPLFAYDLLRRSGCCFLNLERSMRQHQAIIRVLSSRDGFRAERLVRRIIERFHDQDVKDFRSLEQSTPAVSGGS
jgi:DNA-binding GntR family transcriptional regulator